jgi:hypothetical protein
MKIIQNSKLQPNIAPYTQTATTHIEKQTTIQQTPTTNMVQLQPNQNQKQVTAIDVSSIRIGETTKGILCAIRGAIVWKEQNRYKYQRLGPFPFHITEQNKQQIHELFKNQYFQTPIHNTAPNTANMQTRIGNLLERWLQLSISCSAHDSIILWDGSMTAGTPDNPADEMARLLQVARNRLNTVLAFSKNTTLRHSGNKITDLTDNTEPPCLIELNNYPAPCGPMVSLGNINVAKLTSGVCSFRLDIDKQLPREQGIEAVESLLGNDLLVQSYPETLRLAHIYSTFTATEVIGIQRFIAQQYGLRTVTRPNVRRMLFGPYGKGAEAKQ